MTDITFSTEAVTLLLSGKHVPIRATAAEVKSLAPPTRHVVEELGNVRAAFTILHVPITTDWWKRWREQIHVLSTDRMFLPP